MVKIKAQQVLVCVPAGTLTCPALHLLQTVAAKVPSPVRQEVLRPIFMPITLVSSSVNY